MVHLQQVYKYYGANLVVSDLTFEIKAGEKVGLIGRNGTGKTTLLRLIAGIDKPDQGEVSIRRMTKIGYLEQIPACDEQATVYDVLAGAYAEAHECQQQMRALEAAMADEAVIANEQKLSSMLDKYARLQEQFEQAGGYEMDARIRQIAAGFGIPLAQLDQLFASLSGGEKTKIGLAVVLLGEPTLLLLDEPTNHLDVRAVEWLEDYLKSYNGTCLVVSHDRYFLDRVIQKVIEIEDGDVSVYFTNYTGYVQEKQERLLRQFDEYQDQQKKIKQMKEAIKRYQEWGRIGSNPKFFRRAAAIQKALDRMDKIKRPILQRRQADFQFNPKDRSGNDVLSFQQVTKFFEDRCLFRQISGLLRYREKVAVIGDNGTGKSTLFRLFLGEHMPDEGEIRWGSRVEVGYLAQEQRQSRTDSVLQYFREETALEEGEARGQLAKFLFYGADAHKGIHQLSGGEWARLRLAILMYRKPNLLLLDEPTNHLDIESRESLEETLEDFPGTILAISHDRYFINKLVDKIWHLHDQTLTESIGNYESFRAKRDTKD